MRKYVGVTLIAAVIVLAAWRPEQNKADEVRIVQVQRGDVHQIAALAGRLAYEEESFLFARMNGIVSGIYTSPSKRVGEGELLLRIEPVHDIMAAFMANGADIPEKVREESASLFQTDATLVRAEEDCTVRQLLVSQQIPVAAGTPLVRVTSNEQMVVCNTYVADSSDLKTGMWAWLSVDGESLGFGIVESIGEDKPDALTGMICREVILTPERYIELPEGAAIDVDVFLRGSDDVMTLPVEAITDRETVWWVNEGKCTEIPAEIVMCDEILAWVALPEGISVAVGEFKEGQLVVEAAE